MSAHRIVLYSSSPYLKALLTNEMAEMIKEEVTIKGIGGDSLRSLISFCYSGIISIDEDNVDDLVGAASLLCMTRVERLCEKYYLQKLCRDNCLGIWQLANQYELAELKKSANAMALEEFVFVSEKEEFLELQPKSIEVLLASDALYVYSEQLVFNALIRWTEHDEKERRTSFGKLIKLVRMNRIRPAVRFIIMHIRANPRQVVFSFCNPQIILKTVMPYFRRLNLLDLFADLTTQSSDDVSDTEIPVARRTWGEHPLPVSVGRVDSLSADHLLICQYSYIERAWTPMKKLPGCRYDYGLVQADQYLFIIGGRDRTNLPLHTVSMIFSETR